LNHTLATSLSLIQFGKPFGSPPHLVQAELCKVPLSTLGKRLA
jgi:hypothetical protein